MPEVQNLFSVGERMPVDIDRVAFPSDIHIFGGHFGSNSYYADYCGIARRYAPRRILEIGVRFGYSCIALCHGSREGNRYQSFPIEYVGLDGEFFSMEYDGPQGYTYYRSNAVAADRFSCFFEPECARINPTWFAVNTQLQPLPPEVVAQTFDLVNVDGDHSYEGALRDCRQCWPLLAPGGLMLVDDTGMVNVRRAIEDFAAEVERAGERIEWQWYPNERGLCILRKGGA